MASARLQIMSDYWCWCLQRYDHWRLKERLLHLNSVPLLGKTRYLDFNSSLSISMGNSTLSLPTPSLPKDIYPTKFLTKCYFPLRRVESQFSPLEKNTSQNTATVPTLMDLRKTKNGRSYMTIRSQFTKYANIGEGNFVGRYTPKVTSIFAYRKL